MKEQVDTLPKTLELFKIKVYLKNGQIIEGLLRDINYSSMEPEEIVNALFVDSNIDLHYINRQEIAAITTEIITINNIDK